MKEVKLYLEAKTFADLDRLNFIETIPVPNNSGDSFGGFKRAQSWILNCDCAFISGWHEVKDENDIEIRRQNKINNNEIQKALRTKGYGVIRAIGNYGGTIERSFLTFDYLHKGQSFYNDVKSLSEQYQQESFLFKYASTERAFYVYTAGEKAGKKKDAGKLSMCPLNETNFSKIGTGKFIFNPD